MTALLIEICVIAYYSMLILIFLEFIVIHLKYSLKNFYTKCTLKTEYISDKQDIK